MKSENYKAGFVGVIGKPNAGKSTLVNTLVRDKISIVTDRPQTTRRRISGIVSQDAFQAIFVDAPGIIKKTAGLNEFLKEEHTDVVRSSDILMVLFNIDEKSEDFADELIAIAKESGKTWFGVITKTDLPKVHRAQILREKLSLLGIPVVAVSAKADPAAARDLVFEQVEKLLPEAEAPLYDPELYTTENVRQMTAEIIREKCFECFHQEVPYGMAVTIRKFEEGGPVTKIFGEIIVEKDSHKLIVIGRGGMGLKKVGVSARADLEKMLGKQVFLDLHLVVKPKWVKNNYLMKELGYVVQK